MRRPRFGLLFLGACAVLLSLALVGDGQFRSSEEWDPALAEQGNATGSYVAAVFVGLFALVCIVAAFRRRNL